MIVRWLGAFRSGSDSLAGSLCWELENQGRAVAAEHFTRGQGHIEHALVGLALAKGSLIRYFPGDVWSELSEDGRSLKATRASCYATSAHSECFCVPSYAAIILKQHPNRLRKNIWQAVKDAANQYRLPVLWLDARGKRHRISL